MCETATALKINFHISLQKRNNLDNQQRLRCPKRSGTTALGDNAQVKSTQGDNKYSNRMDIYSDSNENAIKIDDETTSENNRPPQLPPRPPLTRPRNTVSRETGEMIYSCRFLSAHAKWCPINWLNWKSFSPFFSPGAPFPFWHAFSRENGKIIWMGSESKERQWGKMWIGKVFTLPLNGKIWHIAEMRTKALVANDFTSRREFYHLCEGGTKESLG